MSDYTEIKNNCLEKFRLWEDPDFPTTESSIFYHQIPSFEFQWKRPHQIYENPQLIQEGYDGFDVVTGSLGDRWLLACFGVLSMYKGLFFRVVPEDQKFDSKYAGIFRFCIWWSGQWIDVLVDDRLPTVHGKLAFMHCSHSVQLWPALLEKAYAKMHGSYEALKYGNLNNGLVVFTGGITQNILLSSHVAESNTLYILNHLVQTTSIVTAYPTYNSLRKIESGIRYRICKIEKVETQAGDLHLVHLAKPVTPKDRPITHIIINKRKWNLIPLRERERLTSITTGFWMLYTDFITVFSQIDVVLIDGESGQIEATLADKQKWLIKSHQGRWMKGVTAGGCKNHMDFFHMNPQFQIVLNAPDTVFISLSQHSLLEPKVIGFNIYRTEKPFTEIAPRTFFKNNKNSFISNYTNSRQICERCNLENGTYLVVPTTFKPRQEGDFTLRVCSLKELKMDVLDCTPRTLKEALLKPPSQLGSEPFQLFDLQFLQVADEHKTINAFELQELLETVLPNDYIKSCATLETCRQIVLSMEKDCLGRITLNDFKVLVYSLRSWQATFKRHSMEKLGVLRAERFRDVLRDVGFVVPERVMALLVVKYMKKDGTLRFGDFVCAVVLLNKAFDMFYSNSSARIQLTFSEWLTLTLTC